MIENITEIDKIRPVIKELNKGGKRICIVSEIRTGYVMGIYETILFTQSEGQKGEFQLRGKEVSLAINKYINLSTALDFNFLTKYNEDVNLTPETTIWFSNNQFGYLWIIA